MCKVLKVSTSGYYSLLKAKVSKLWLYNQKLSELITSIFKDNFESYGATRIKTAVEKLGHYISRPRVAKLMNLITPENSDIIICHIDETFNNASHMQQKEKGFRDFFLK